MEAPPPSHILRFHSAGVTVVSISSDNERIYSGDSSGYVFVTSTRSLRPLTSWKAHGDSLLTVVEWVKQIITHGRDNKLHIWKRIEEAAESIQIGGSAALQELPAPVLAYSMDVNALNYCGLSLLPSDNDETALVCLPNLVESSEADVWSLPSCSRIHAGVGKSKDGPILSNDGRGDRKTGIIMSLHLYRISRPPDEEPSSSSQVTSELRLLCAYEDGSVTLRRFSRTDKQTSVEGIGWEVIWSVKRHVEAIMAMTVSPDNRAALTVSADHLIGRYDLTASEAVETACTVHRTKHPQNGCVAFRSDGRVCAVGGWDGRIRLYSSKKFKHLGTLKYHKTNCQAIVFANLSSPREQDGDDEMTEAEKAERQHWLITGSKDNRIAIWTLVDFEKPS